MILIDLIYNLAILISISVFSGFIDQRHHRETLTGKGLQGLLFGLATIIGMMHPFVLTEGIIFDGRSIIISLAAFFFGPFTGLTSAVIAIGYRLWIGGAGSLMGLSVIISSLLIGLAFYYWRKLKLIRGVSYTMLYVLGMSVHLVMMLFILTLPAGFRAETFNIITITVLGGYPVVTVIIGKILLDQKLTERFIADISEKEERYRTTFQSIADAVITTNTEGLVTHINPTAARLTGWNEDEALNKPLDTIVQLFDEETRIKHEPAVDQKVSPDTQKLVLLSKDGTDYPVAISQAAIRGTNKRITGSVLVLRDIGKEREQQEVLKRSEESYRGLFDSITSAIYIQNQQGEFLDVNNGATLMYGYPKNHFTGKTPEFLSAPGKNDLEALQGYIAKAFAGEPQRFEFWGLKANGEVFPKEVNLYKTYYFGQEAIIAVSHDISEREQAQRKVKESEARYRSLFDASPVGIILEDEKGTIIDVNQTICKQYGYSRDELIGQNIVMLAPEHDATLVQKNISEILASSFHEAKVKSRTKEGRELVVQLTETTMVLPDGRKGILSISKDITEQVAVENMLRKNEMRTSAIITALPDLLFRISKSGVYLDFFAENTDILYVEPEHFLGKNVSEIMPPELAKLTLDNVANTLNTGTLQQYEYSLDIGGAPKWFDARMTQSGPDEVLVIVRDISSRKQNDLELAQKTTFIETLLDSVPNPLFYMNKRGYYLGVNKAFLEFYKLKKNDIIGKRIFDLDPPEDAERNFKSDQLILEGWEKKQFFERRITLPDGIVRDVIVTKSPFPDANNNIGGLIGIIVDITSRKSMEKELIAAKEKAEESDNLKTAFLNNLSHEIRTPMNAIVGFSSLLGEDYDEEQKNQFVNLVQSNAEQLLRIIDDVLIVSRLDAEKLPVEEEAVELYNLFEMLYATFLPEAKKGKIELQRPILDKGVPKTVISDNAKIIQVMSGLLNNAIKYTRKGHVAFGCRLNGNRLHFFVNDTGIGIHPDEQPKVFDRFFRSSEAMLSAIRGNGLGLSIAKGLVELLDGSIGLQSEPGKGSSFYFELTLKPSKQQSKPAPASISEEKLNDLQLKILVAEDEDDNYEFIEMLLKGKVKSILRAKDGETALKLIKTNTFDLVLMDIKMPLLNGIEVTHEATSLYPNLPIIALSAYAQTEEIKKALDAGCKAYVAKPVKKEELLNKIKQLLVRKEGS